MLTPTSQLALTLQQLPTPLRWMPFILLACLYSLGLPLDLMEVDAAQYASIAREMAQTGNWLQVQHRGLPYLDKPPLCFWLSAVSFKLLGVSNWAYRLPSLGFALLAIYTTYRFARLYYQEATAYLAALLLASSQALFLMTNDCRTDTILMGSVALAMWQLAAYLVKPKLIHALWAAIALSLALLAKGPIGLLVPLVGFAAQATLARRWSSVLQPRFIIPVLLLMLLLLAPMLWGLWQQQGFAGWRFYFWEQSFGRITGSNVWKNDDSPSLFFFHTFLWLFLPYSLLTWWGIWQLVRRWTLRNPPGELLALTSFVLPFVVLSFSHYKLPHYLYVVLPAGAVLAAPVLLQWLLAGHGAGFWGWLLLVVSIILLVLAFMLAYWAFTPTHWAWGVGALSLLGIGVYANRHLGSNLRLSIVSFGVTAMGATNLLLAGAVYPALLHYQASSTAGHKLAQQATPQQAIVALDVGGHNLDFLTGRIIPNVADLTQLLPTLAHNPTWVFTNAKGRAALYDAGAQPATIDSFPSYNVSLLTPTFINPCTRHNVVTTAYLLYYPSTGVGAEFKSR